MQSTHRFSALDSIVPSLYNALIFTFPCSQDSHPAIFETLKEGLARAVSNRPFLAGSVIRDTSPIARRGDLKLEQHLGDVIDFVYNDLTQSSSPWQYSYLELQTGNMPLSKLDPDILAPLVTGHRHSPKVVSAQANFIPGGCLLVINFSHSFFDATGMSTFMHYWASFTREVQGEVTDHSQGADFDGAVPALHSLTTKHRPFAELKLRPELWRLLCLDSVANLRSTGTCGQSSAPLPPTNFPAAKTYSQNLRTAMFAFSPQSLRQLKAAAAPKPPEWISTKDALHALTWRCIMRARSPQILSQRQPTDKTVSTLSIAVNGRSLVRPPVPLTYLGNVVFFVLPEMSLSALVSAETSLAEVAVLIRREIASAQDPELLADAINLAASIPDVSNLRIAIQDYFGAQLSTTCAADMPFYDLDFGPMFAGTDGRCEYFRIPRGQFGAITSVQPKQRDGTVDIIVGLEGKQMDSLKADPEWVKYARFISE